MMKDTATTFPTDNTDSKKKEAHATSLFDTELSANDLAAVTGGCGGGGGGRGRRGGGGGGGGGEE